MKIILSRKGFDSQFGGYPSPILDDGSLISLPIPASEDVDRYAYLKLPNGNGESYYDLLSQLTHRGIKVKKGKREPLDRELTCYRDPDIYTQIIPRDNGWRGCFGQSKQAQSHLDSKQVDKGDLFLFFGWFRREH